MDRSHVYGLVKDWLFAGVIAATVGLVWSLAAGGPLSEGDAPALDLRSTSGEAWSLSHRDAEGYVVNFWATWCGPCKKEIPEITAFAKAHPEIEVIGVSVDDKLSTERLGAEAKRLGITYGVLHDAEGRAARDWRVDVYPTTFVLDRDLNIVATRVGEIDRARLEDMLPPAVTASARGR